jgi:FkbM family methyltransferase
MGVWRSTLRARVKPLVYRFRSKLLYKVATFYVNTVDNDNDSDYATNGEAAFVRKHLRGAKVAFDVGAAKGEWTDLALAADPGVVVHCFEPTTRRFKLLLEKNFGDRVVLNQLGLGDATGESQIFYDASGGSNSLFPQRYDGASYDQSNVETVKVTTIDQYCRERSVDYVDFIKLDIEGYEMAAFRGAERMLRGGRIGIVQFEYSQAFLDAGASMLQLMKYVQDIGPTYQFHKILPDGTRPIATYDHALDNFKTQNWAIIKS